MEVRSELCLLAKDNSHSWVRISHGSNKFVTNLNNNEQDISEVQLEENALKLNASDFACQSKAKAKPQKREPAGSSTKTIPIGERFWTDVEPKEYSLSDCSVSKKLINLLGHGRLPREDDGAIDFWRIKDYLQNNFVYSQHWSDEKWKSSMARGGGNQNTFQYCTDASREILYLRALQGHSGRNLVDPSLQDNVLIPDGFFKYIYHVGCAINLQDHGILGRHQSCSEERIEVLSSSIERYHSSRNTPSLLYSESCKDGNWRSHLRESIYVTSASSQHLLET